jgi:hypothetical protein
VSSNIEAPQEGTIWRERRRQYQRRTVEVVGMAADGKVIIRTKTNNNGQPVRRIRYTRVQLGLWHKTFELVEIP